ncbi:Uncharacterised protein [Enterobacter kobei]|uniref:hypothetical protein n=1 Tax=Enterobacter kobei TaxID=208224 RepID=UPI00125BDEF0|nr:Uncharacterised protein [Enterobacter kobei]
MSVKRYEWMACDEHSCHCDVVESAEGDMVDYEDYAALEARCAALASEVYDLKHPGTYLPSKRETPALDAFLAEVRAQGVEMFGQYHNFSEKLFIQKEAKKFATKLRREAAQ